VHFLHPVTEAVHNHAPYNRMIRIQRVSCASEVRVAALVFFQQIVRGIIQTSEALCRATLSTFCGVIEDHVENDFDAGAVQGLHYIPKFIERTQRLLTRAVGLVWCKK
jgi:hypothetical protein